ncbi:MAG TPA: mechanosensitive ion channel family protein [Candidatus Acidoferrales bacterium]|nr:mechanosensitive ion channel family protein [Candidatus Acidoferrales bacterium]
MRSGFDTIRRRLIEDPMEVLLPVIVFAVTFLLGWIVRRLFLRALKAWNTRTNSRAGHIFYNALHAPTRIWVLILAIHVGLQMSDLPPRFTHEGANILLSLWILSITVMCTRFAGDLVRFYGAQVPGALPVTTLSQNLVQIAVVILGVLILLNHFNVSITPILTALGVGGLAVALALQDTLSNLFGGFYVAIARQIQVGDYIKLNTGEEGYVADIGWRSTLMRALSNNMIIVPNAKLAQAIVTNYSLPEKRTGTSVQVTVGYDCDPDAVEALLLEVLQQSAAEIPEMLKEPAPGVGFDPGFSDYGYSFNLGFQVAEFSDQGRIRNEVRRRVARRLRAENIGFSYPARTVFLRGSGRKNPAKPAPEEPHQ